MDRKSFLTAKTSPAKKQNFRVTSGLLPYSGTWGKEQIIHLLKRALFGASINDVNFFTGKSLQNIVNTLCSSNSNLTKPPVKNYDTAGALLPDTILAGETWVLDGGNNDGTINARRMSSFKQWWIGNLVNQERNLVEKMTLFWHNHFATETQDVINAKYAYKTIELLRKFALGNFKVLTKEVTLDPGMLVYLNGRLNTVTAPDENYGRELQELFCVGKGVNNITPPYTENDVKAAAKVLTGWNIDGNTISTTYNKAKHDATNKQFSAFYNNTVITGNSSTNGGNVELDALLDMIFKKEEVSEFICRKLYRWFIYYDIDAVTEENVIKPLAKIFRDNNFEIVPVIKVLLSSEHFFDSANIGCQIKSPIDFIVGSVRELDIMFPSATDYIGSYDTWEILRNQTSIMQQNIGDPPNVAGWQAYYQAPQFYQIWINSDTLPKRTQFTDLLSTTGYTRNGKKILFDVLGFTKKLAKPDDPNLLIAEVEKYFYQLKLSVNSKNQIKEQILLSNQTSDYYWTNAWTAYLTNPNAANTAIVKTRLTDFYKYIFSLSEFQLA
jgi:uncharacterized protein (DUF1800 family)